MTALVGSFFLSSQATHEYGSFLYQFLKPWRAESPSDLTHCPNGTRIFGSNMGLCTSSVMPLVTDIHQVGGTWWLLPFPVSVPPICYTLSLLSSRLSTMIPQLTGSCKVIW